MTNRLAKEAAFQNWVEGRFYVAGGHVQPHTYGHYPDVPDLSAAFKQQDFWLELKYDEFTMKHGSKYSMFEFSTTTRGQLEWLRDRKRQGQAYCGVLAEFAVDGNPRTHVAFLDVDFYLRRCWRADDYCVGAALLSPLTRARDEFKAARDLPDFIRDAYYRVRENGGSL